MYEDYYDKVYTKYYFEQMKEDEKAAIAAQKAIRHSVESNIGKLDPQNDDDGHVVLQPLPLAGLIKAEEARQSQSVMPSDQAMEKEAMELTRSHMRNLAAEDKTPEEVVDDIERTLLGITLRITTSNIYSNSESPASPSIQIFGTQRKIDTKIKVLPLKGATVIAHTRWTASTQLGSAS